MQHPRVRASWTFRVCFRLSGKARRDDGLSVVEVSIAIVVFAVVAAFMSQMLAGGLKGVLLGKRREVATQEANRTIEIARSLAYAQIGLVQADTTINSDPAITTVDGLKSYRSDATWEPLLFATNPSGHPFNPHVQELKRAATGLTRYIYVTGVDQDSNGTFELKRLSVRVTWEDTARTGSENEVRAQTLIDENGLVPLAGIPTSTGSPPPGTTLGPVPMTADSTATSGTISVKSARGSIVGLVNAVLPETPVTVAMPSTTGETKFRAVSQVDCTTKSSTFTGASNTIGGHGVTARADNDATSATPVTPVAQVYSGSPADSLGLGDDIDDVLSQATVASPVSCQATASDTDGVAPTDDSLPYEKGTASAVTTLNVIEDLTGLGVANTLDAVVVTAAPVVQEIDFQTVSGTREVLSSATGSSNTVQVLTIPSVFANGLVQVDSLSYSASVRGSGGTPSAAPTVSAPTVNLRVFDSGSEVAGCASRSANYCILAVDAAAGGFSGQTINYSHNFTVGLANFMYDVRVEILPPTLDPLAGVTGPNGEKRWSAEYSPVVISARLKAELTVNVLTGIKVLLTDTAVEMNLGSLRTEACAGVTCI